MLVYRSVITKNYGDIQLLQIWICGYHWKVISNYGRSIKHLVNCFLPFFHPQLPNSNPSIMTTDINGQQELRILVGNEIRLQPWHSSWNPARFMGSFRGAHNNPYSKTTMEREHVDLEEQEIPFFGNHHFPGSMLVFRWCTWVISYHSPPQITKVLD